jgi:hypothetical protein
MSRYIDIDDVANAIYHHFPSVRTMADARSIIEEAPSIDIVRCKECKHNPWDADYDYTCIWDDDFADRPQTPNDFCSYGEREGE